MSSSKPSVRLGHWTDGIRMCLRCFCLSWIEDRVVHFVCTPDDMGLVIRSRVHDGLVEVPATIVATRFSLR